MSEIPKAYEPQSVEDKWYEFWVKQGCFTADPARVSDKRPAYSIVIPPPNVTGMLHMGHVLNNTIQDILSRKARMDGKEVLWLPGTDHAGIATEGMVAKQIRKEEKKSKQEIGREEFIKRVWTWKEKHGGIIIQQLKKLGCSCDWTRERFTMDPDYVRNVQRVFVDLYKKGLIYRGKRMVNWCPATQTALSDEEVEMKPQKGFMYHFKVEAVEADGSPVQIANALPLIDDFLGRATVVPELKAANRWEAIDELIAHLVSTGKIQTADCDAVTAAIKKREASMSTGIGFGIGIPHASTDLVKEVVAVLGRSTNGINFDALDSQPVKLVMLFLVPQGQFQKHQHALANIAKLLHKKEFREALENFSESPTATKKGGPEIDSQGRVWLTIATTRPETIPGDTAVAVNPKDTRYAHLIGKHIVRPLPIHVPREQKLIPIIGDEHVDFEFGTGVLKVTPAHDKADFDIGQRHKLPIVDIMHADGTMNDLAGADLRGLERFKARKVASEKLTELGVLVEEKPYENNVGFSQRADVPIEPRLSEQWFLKYPSVEVSKACVEQPGSATVPVADSGVSPESSSRAGIPVGETPTGAGGTPALPKMRFHPDRWAKVYDHWLTNIQDWCISRQLWWGHRVPVWTKHFANQHEFWGEPGTLHDELQDFLSIHGKHEVICVRFAWDNRPDMGLRDDYPGMGEGGFTVVVATDTEKVTSLSGEEYPLVEKLEQAGFTQDPDVLDTWFSSWLWPFATMGWNGEKSQDSTTPTLRAFYPTTDLVTGPDIIFFWVARMIMAGYEFMGDLPFKNVYFTGIIRDKQGRKMSKTLGNSPDPLVLISQYGADALRFGTMRSAPLGQDVLFDEKDVELGRNFCNKLWNACRFRQMQGGEVQGEMDAKLLSSDDQWILLRLDLAIREVSDALASYNFATAVQTLYRFFWSEYCDWYVEASKAAFFGEDAALKANKVAVIDFVLSHLLRMFHPLLPYITEELWHGMGYSADMPEDQGGKTIMFARWPKPLSDEEKEAWGLDDTVETFANAKFELVTQGRNLKTQFNIGAGKKGKFTLKPAGNLAPGEAEVLRLLLSAESLDLDPNYAPKKGTPTALTKLGELYLPLDGLVDTEAERTRLTKKTEEYLAEIAKVEQKLANPSFTQKVPPAVLEEHKQRLADWQTKLTQTKTAIEALG